MRTVRGPVTYTSLTGSIIRESEKAIRFHVDQPGHILHDETFWFPISQCDSITRSHNSELDQIRVADWLIEKKCDDLGSIGG